MKILHLLGDSADLGGILSVIRCLHDVAASTGAHHVVLVRANYSETRKPALDYRYSRYLRAESPNHPKLLLGAFPATAELVGLLRRESFDVVHAHTRGALPVAMLQAALFRQPVLCTHHTYARRTWLYRVAARLPLLHTVVLTPNMARHYGFSPSTPRLSVISACCADAYFQQPLPVHHRTRTISEPLRLLGVGNIVRWKKWDLLLDALLALTPAERQSLHFTHCGQAPADFDSQTYHQELRNKIQAHHLEPFVHFVGQTSDIQRHVRECDWFVIPSTNEPCSVALIEALALGKPALVSASGGNVDIVDHGVTGLLFAPDDPQALSLKLRLLLSAELQLADPPKIRNSVSHRCASHVARLYAELYRKLPLKVRRAVPPRPTEPSAP